MKTLRFTSRTAVEQIVVRKTTSSVLVQEFAEAGLVVCRFPRFVETAQLKVEWLIEDEWLTAQPILEPYTDPTGVARQGKVCGYSLYVLPGTYRFTYSWDKIVETGRTGPEPQFTEDEHLRAFHIVELGNGELFDSLKPEWLAFGLYASIVRLHIPERFDGNIHLHFRTPMQILLRHNAVVTDTVLNVEKDGATLLVWGPTELAMLQQACEAANSSSNIDHRVHLSASPFLPEARWQE